MTLRELINSVDSEQYSDNSLYSGATSTTYRKQKLSDEVTEVYYHDGWCFSSRNG